MIIRFRERFRLPADEVFSYFQTPADWARLFGMAGTTKDLGDGWYARREWVAAARRLALYRGPGLCYVGPDRGTVHRDREG